MVGNIVSEKVAVGTWGVGTVDELGKYIALKLPGLSGFNRRGLYRMKQFFEIYSSSSECFSLWLQSKYQKVSPVATQLENTDNQHEKFVSAALTQIAWTNHLEIFSAVKDSVQNNFFQKLFQRSHQNIYRIHKKNASNLSTAQGCWMQLLKICISIQWRNYGRIDLENVILNKSIWTVVKE